MKIGDVNIDIYADGADIESMVYEYKKGIVKGFTTNPTLMKKAGVKSYTSFVQEVTTKIKDLPLSFEVFSDDFDNMEKEAEILASYGDNVYVKIPVTNTKGESSAPLIKKLSKKRVNINVTAVFTTPQVEAILEAFEPGSNNIISVFAGRIADAGLDPEPLMKKTAILCHQHIGTKSLWASSREVFNIFQAERCGVDIITVTNEILSKMGSIGKDLEGFSLETVRMFARDGKELGFSINEGDN